MREIKFRGMLKHNKEWVYGFFVRDESEFIIYVSRSICTDKETNFYENVSIPEYVIPETVEQYTGLKDKNGKEIFEGDVVSFKDLADGLIDFTIGVVEHEKGSCALKVREKEVNHRGGRYWCVWDLITDIEIIGNIHTDEAL